MFTDVLKEYHRRYSSNPWQRGLKPSFPFFPFNLAHRPCGSKSLSPFHFQLAANTSPVNHAGGSQLLWCPSPYSWNYFFLSLDICLLFDGNVLASPSRCSCPGIELTNSKFPLERKGGGRFKDSLSFTVRSIGMMHKSHNSIICFLIILFIEVTIS